MAITKASLEKLKSGSISKVVEALGGTAKRVGREFVTQCVWHDDTNPSLTINDEKGFCYCHVCREGGDVIKYVQQRKGLSFPDAANLSAEILGIALETDGISDERRAELEKQRKEALAALQTENDEYKGCLRSAKANRIWDIIENQRGISRETADAFGLGYAPKGFFEGRITIPILDHRSKLVGWTGRTTKDHPAKYKNSSDSDLFNKKSLVFNEARAKEAARLAGSLIFVEGHLDVVSLYQHGIANVVAMQGTGAPEKYVIERLARSVNNFVLCFDGDEGGKKAVQKFIEAAGPMAQAGQVQINVAQLPYKKDPDDICREGGADAFHSLVAEAMPWLDWVIDFWAADLDKENSAHVTAVEKALREVIDGLQSNALRAHYVDKVARALARDEKEAVVVAKQWQKRSIPLEERKWTPRTPEQTRVAVERRMLRIYVHCPEHRDRLNPYMKAISHPPLQWLVERLRELYKHCVSDLTPHSIAAVVAVAEPHFLGQLRTIIQPNVHIDDSPGVLAHIDAIMSSDLREKSDHDTSQAKSERV